MKARTLITLLTVNVGLIAVCTYATSTRAPADAKGSAPQPPAASAETESTPRVNVKAVAANLEFLDKQPTLTGQPVLLEFWATWCPPCRTSIAHLNELNTKYHDRGLQIVGISGEEKDAVERFRARTPMNYTVALDKDQALASAFQVRSIPQAWLLDKAGRVVWSGHPMELDEQTITRVLTADSAS